ncbi:hypothetical protein D3C84_862830 [compost metagenome]
MPPPRLTQLTLCSSGPKRSSMVVSIWSNKPKSPFSQLLWNIKPEIWSITPSIFAGSHSPRRLNGRAGSASR